MFYRKAALTLEGTKYTTQTFDDVEVDICNDVMEFFGHDDFIISYEVETVRTIGGIILHHKVDYSLE